MRKILLLLLLTASFILSQDLNGYRIYVNPGHGGHDSNDRYIAATGFWESEGNLTKGLRLREMLEDLGATVGISRVANNSSDDLPLSQIGALSNSFNADYFHSIHSNAHDTQTNYVLLLFRGYDNNPVFDEAKEMAQIMWDQLQNTNRVYWQYSWVNARGDWDFYGSTSGLGVLRQLSMPGTLSEGSFHDYIPESWRLQSLDYRKNEAWAISRSFLEHYNKPGYPHGILTGLMRDPNQQTTYWAISAVTDHKAPINLGTVTLQPGNKVYTTDEMNNGFYMFDSLEPGQYTVYFESPEYQKDSSVVTVTANNVKFADKLLQFDTTIPPDVLSYSPEDGGVDVKTTSAVKVKFSRSMKIAETEAAFSMSPAVDGTFSWENENMEVTFIPDEVLDVSTEYTVTVTTGAVSIYDVAITDELSFSFTTNDRNRYTAKSLYPLEGEDEASTYVQIRLEFDAPIDQSTISGKINLFDWDGNRISVTNVEVTNTDDNCFINFEPKNKLEYNSDYSVILTAGLKDAEGYPLPEDYVLNFNTTGEEVIQGSVIDNFEDVNDWNDPAVNPLSVNINADNTTIGTFGKRKISGTKSMRLEYEYTDAAGTVYLSTDISSNIYPGDSGYGIWVFGDNSGNVLSVDMDNNGTSVLAELDTINFTGWKMLKFNAADYTPFDSLTLKALVLTRAAEGNSDGALYFDDLQSNPTTTDVENEAAKPTSFVLFQNYPNPFNPSTTIRYSLPETAKVTLKIYNMLGQEVTTLVNREMNAGMHTVNFDAAGLASGIYIYQINAGHYTSAKKFTLLK